ncbi:MAG: type II toxin-antitoxin system VapC family toxin [Planctomycetales bacterium]
MKLVLDACIGIKWILPEIDSAQAIALRDDFRNQIHELIAPDTFPPEVAHALTRAERKGTITQQSAAMHFMQLLANLPQIYQSLPLLPRAYELSSQFRIGVYDCLYIAIAEREQCQVVTADQKMLTLFPTEAVFLADM